MVLCDKLCNGVWGIVGFSYAENKDPKETAAKGQKIPPPKLMGVAVLKKYYFLGGIAAGAGAAAAGAAAAGFGAGAGAGAAAAAGFGAAAGAEV
jgi:hypothetical protein